MDIRYLHCFVSVVECGSIAEVARRLDLTPAAVAARIRSLEQDLDVALIQRDGRSVKPTQEGLKILDKAKTLVRDARGLQACAKDANTLGEFRLGASTSVLSTMLPRVFAAFFECYPQLSMFVEPGTSSHLYHQVTTGNLDAAIIVQPQFSIPKGFSWQLLVEDELTVVAPANMQTREPHDILQNEPFLRYDRSTWGGRMADRYLQKHELHPKERLEIDGAAAISAMVAQGLGVSLIPLSLIEPVEAGKVIHLSLPFSAPKRRMGVLWATQRAQSNLASAFATHALGALKSIDTTICL